MRTFSRILFLSLLLLLLLEILLLSGCTVRETDTPTVVCTVYPLYDFTVQLLGSADGVLLLSDHGNDPHNYQPTVRDMIAVENAALFLYVGGVSDVWATEIAKTEGSALALMDVIDPCESDHGHTSEEHGHHDHDHDDADEHFWLSFSNAKKAVSAIADALLECGFCDSEVLSSNESAYLSMLDALYVRYEAAVANAVRREIMVADRFPFLYLTSEFDLTHYAAFPGCSAETEASFSTVVSLVETLKAKELPIILVTETGDRALAETILRVAGADAEILTLHSCQSVTSAEREAGVTYLSLMEENLAVLVRALSDVPQGNP